jgi:ATP-dependent helicase Lhr and Lhr-like helicase
MADGAQRLEILPQRFRDWFAARGWSPRPHQLALTEAQLKGEDALLIAPTGGGKTLAGFLASLIELSECPPPPPAGEVPPRGGGGSNGSNLSGGFSPPSAARAAATSPASGGGALRPALHTLYVSPLKALAVDVARNLMQPVEEMGLPIRIETRTGDTPPAKRQRQRANPPDILLTTPEQIALFIASDHARAFFADLKCVIIDEIHALAPGKRGDLLALGLATLREFAPDCRFVGLSATVKEPEALARWLSPRPSPSQHPPPPQAGEVPRRGGGGSNGKNRGGGFPQIGRASCRERV